MTRADVSHAAVPSAGMPGGILAIVAARDEAERIAATLAGLRRAFPHVEVWVADDGSSDDTATIARRAGARVVRAGARRGGRVCNGKGQAMTAAAGEALASACSFDDPLASNCSFDDLNARARVRACGHDDLDDSLSPRPDDFLAFAPRDSLAPQPRSSSYRQDDVSSPSRPRVAATATEPIVVLCDGDLGASARELGPLVQAIDRDEADLAVAAFRTRARGGLGIALAFARWAVRQRCGLRTRATLSGQRALRASVLAELLPFAPGYGMEPAMTIDAVRAGARVIEIDLPLSHRPTGRTPAGFAHRARQLGDFVRVYLARRWGRANG